MATAGVIVEHRPLVARILVRSILRISPYAKDRKALTSCRSKNPILPPQVEAVIWRWVRDMRWDWKVNTCYWRATACVFETRDFSRAANTFNVPVEDIAYMIAQMSPEDIDYFVKLERSWRTSPIDNAAITAVIKMCKPYINTCVHKLSFVSKYDPGRDSSDWHAYFSAEALQVIYMYEDRKSLHHLVNTVKLALKNKLGIMQGRYSSMKHGMLVNSKSVDPLKKVKKKDGTVVSTRETNSLVTYVNRRATLMVQSPDGGDEVENPELLSRSTKIEGDLETDIFIRHVEKQSVHLARYLKLVTKDDHDDAEFSKWLDHHNYSVDSIRDLAAKAAIFCRISKSDITKLRDIATVNHYVRKANT